MKKSTKISLMGLATIAVLGIGVMIMSYNFRHYFNDEETLRSSSKDDVKEDEEAIKEKQLAYLKEHEQEIVDLIKAQSPKVESVQIDWDETQWSDGGLTKPEYYINLYGDVNHIKESG